MQKITPFLWFDGQAEEAAIFYTSIVRNAGIVSVSHYGDAGPRSKGTVMSVTFVLNGQEFIALNGGPQFKFSPAVSFLMLCETPEEVDYLWDKLSEGGSKNQCGWLQDKYGLTWQIVPAGLAEMLHDRDPQKANRVMAAMLQMTKLEILKLKHAYEHG